MVVKDHRKVGRLPRVFQLVEQCTFVIFYEVAPPVNRHLLRHPAFVVSPKVEALPLVCCCAPSVVVGVFGLLLADREPEVIAVEYDILVLGNVLQ